MIDGTIFPHICSKTLCSGDSFLRLPILVWKTQVTITHAFIIFSHDSELKKNIANLLSLSYTLINHVTNKTARHGKNLIGCVF